MRKKTGKLTARKAANAGVKSRGSKTPSQPISEHFFYTTQEDSSMPDGGEQLLHAAEAAGIPLLAALIGAASRLPPSVLGMAAWKIGKDRRVKDYDNWDRLKLIGQGVTSISITEGGGKLGGLVNVGLDVAGADLLYRGVFKRAPLADIGQAIIDPVMDIGEEIAEKDPISPSLLEWLISFGNIGD